MFQDPLVAVMAMLLLCFAGMMVMFVFVIRSLSTQAEEQRALFRKQQMFLADLERQLIDLKVALARMRGEDAEDGEDEDEDDEEASLSLLRQDDPLLSMLEAAAKNKSGLQLHIQASEAARSMADAEAGRAAAVVSPAEPDADEDTVLPGQTKELADETPGEEDEPLMLIQPEPEPGDEEEFLLGGGEAPAAPADGEETAPVEEAAPAKPRKRVSLDSFADAPRPEERKEAKAPLAQAGADLLGDLSGQTPIFEEQSLRVYRMEKQTPGAGLPDRAGAAQTADPVERLLRDVGYSFAANNTLPRDARPGPRRGAAEPVADARPKAAPLSEDTEENILREEDGLLTLEPLSSLKDFPGLAGRVPPQKVAFNDDDEDDMDDSALGASYRALRSRAEKLFEEVSGAFFTGQENGREESKAEPVADEADGPGVADAAKSLFDMEADAEDAKAGAAFRNFQDMSAAGDSRNKPLLVPDMQEFQAYEPEDGPEESAGEDAGRDEAADAADREGPEPLPAQNSEKGEDAIKEYASRFLADREKGTFAVKAKKAPEKKAKPKKKAAGKRAASEKRLDK